MAQLSDDSFAFGGALMSVEAAGEFIRAHVAPRGGEELVSLAEAEGRILARDLVAAVSLPPFDNSAVDGYAVRHADLNAEGETLLPVLGRVPAGASAAGIATAGRAVRIFTGAIMPDGADTVFMQEDVALEGDRARLPAGLRTGANRRLKGEDIAAGELALPAGRRLGPAELALAAATGVARLPVRPRLTIGVFSTGDELTEPGAPLGDAAIYDANRAMLRAMAGWLGHRVVDLGILRDERESLAAALAEAAGRCDLLLTSGGVSTGEEDHVKAAVESVGRLDFWRIAIKPGRPVAMGVVRGVPFVGLPGNPAAAFITFAAVVKPLAAQLAGAAASHPLRVPVRAAFAYRKKPGRREYVRVSLARAADGSLSAAKYPRDGAGVITSLTATDGLAELVEDSTGVEPGDILPFLSWRELL